jgi:hypothetical protein
MIRPVGCPALILFIVLAGIVGVAAQQPDSSGAFVLHKFARAIGKETYSIDAEGHPLADIHNTRRVWRTVAAGAVYDPAPLWRSVGFTP